jgi:hypothetical protein
LVSEEGWQKRCVSKFSHIQSRDSWKEGKGIWKNKGGNTMEDNPIRNRCPEKQCMSELKKTMAAGNGCVHVHDMVDWMVRQSDEMMAGTEFEGKWHWCHDALSITWAPETIQCIKDRCPGVCERMLRGLGPADADEIKIHKKNDAGELIEEMMKNRHQGKLGGDVSRNMPLDSSLFPDFTLACNRCEALTMHLPWDDARKFTTSTPSQLQRTMDRAWKTSPSSRRIVQDIFRTVTNREHSIAHGPGWVCTSERSGRRRKRMLCWMSRKDSILKLADERQKEVIRDALVPVCKRKRINRRMGRLGEATDLPQDALDCAGEMCRAVMKVGVDSMTLGSVENTCADIEEKKARIIKLEPVDLCAFFDGCHVSEEGEQAHKEQETEERRSRRDAFEAAAKRAVAAEKKKAKSATPKLASAPLSPASQKKALVDKAVAMNQDHTITEMMLDTQWHRPLGSDLPETTWRFAANLAPQTLTHGDLAVIPGLRVEKVDEIPPPTPTTGWSPLILPRGRTSIYHSSFGPI